MTAAALVKELKSSKDFLDRSTRPLAEEHSGFRPVPSSFTAAQQLAHVASTIDWFLEGAFSPDGFSMDFEAHIRATKKVESMQAARAWVDRAYQAAIDKLGSLSDAELVQPLPPGPVLGGQPRAQIVYAIAEHTAHHRGALTIYSRLNGLEPPMPYMDMPE